MLILRNLFLASTLILFSSITANAQKQVNGAEQIENNINLFEVKTGFQFWNVYTMDHQSLDEAKSKYTVYNNWSSLIRRARLNTKLQPSERLLVQTNISADQLNKDNNSATQGGKSNSNKSISVLDLYARYKIKESSDLLVLTVGLQRPMIGRETVVSALQTSSLEKSISQYYQRKQIVGSGNGRTVGVNIGGVLKFSSNPFSIWYNVGSFTTPSFYQEDDITSPLFAGRLGIDIGDPEATSYSTSAKTNYFGMRDGLTLATSFSYQGRTSIFDRSYSLGFDFLFNLGHLNIDGELFAMYREKVSEQSNIRSASNGGYLRAGYSIATHKKQYLEPVVMYTFFTGGATSEEILHASRLNAFSGVDNVLEVGVNYYITSPIKLSLFYTYNQGSSKHNNQSNNFHDIDSIGRRIRRGDYLALAITINL